TLGSGVSGSGSISIEAGAQLNAANIRQGALNVSGKAIVIPNGTVSGTSALSNLTIAGTTDNWSGQLDLTDNDLIVHSTAGNRTSDVQRISNQIRQGANFSANNSSLF